MFRHPDINHSLEQGCTYIEAHLPPRLLRTCLSDVIQRGNAVCFAGTAPSSGDLNMDI